MIIDLFAGPGGWDLGARWAGVGDPVGFEWGAEECVTRAAAGLLTVRADLATYPPTGHLRGRVDGLIASPPCPAFSTAGTGAGNSAVSELAALIDAAFDVDHHRGERRRREVLDAIAAAHPEMPAGKVAHYAAMSSLVATPFAWVAACEPTWVACEQVPPALPLWEHAAARLRERGYRTWCGVLCAADYGVPQTRRRAILLAHRGRQPRPPDPTHAEDPQPTLFGAPLERWVSMAEALGWGMTARPSFTLAPGKGGDAEGVGGAGARAALRRERQAGRWQVGFPRRDDRGDSPDGYRERDWSDADGPAPTLDTTAGQWTFTKPATTVTGDPRIPARARHVHGGQGRGAVSLSDAYDGTSPVKLDVTDALVLQSFPADWPLHGERSAQFRQAGNAVPPLLAAHILAALAGGG